MEPSLLPLAAADPDGYLLVLALFVPVVGVLVAFCTGGRGVRPIAMTTIAVDLAIVATIAVRVAEGGAPLVYRLGGWSPPLGVALRADGLAVVMLGIVAVVMAAVAIFARPDFATPDDRDEARQPFAFWILLLGLWAGLNAVFLSGDLFTQYVALEMLTFAAVPLVSLDGQPEKLTAALRYLLFALLGSILYLGGAGLLYGGYGTLDIALLSERVVASPATCIAAALMTVGLLAKTALYPLHLWLPPAHAGAHPAASAVLSALVVKGSFFITVRLWFEVMPGLPGAVAAQLLSALGAAAIFFGSVVALRQRRLKLLIAYSTLAQIGYLFLMFALAVDPASGRLVSGDALAGGILQATTHAAAKAAMFMAAGLLYASLGHDRIGELGGAGRASPLGVLAFALAGLALMGVPPSGAYLAKDLLLQSAAATGQGWGIVVLNGGGVLTSSYVFLVLAHALGPAERPLEPRPRAPWLRQAAVVGLAVVSLSLGLFEWAALLPLSAVKSAGPWSIATVWKLLWPALGGAGLAILVGRWGGTWGRSTSSSALAAALAPVRSAAVAVATAVERSDAALRQWGTAGLSMLLLTILFGAAIWLGAGAS